MLKERMLLKIQDVFVYIRFNAYFENADALKYHLEQLKEVQSLIAFFAKDFQKDILLYCVDHLSEFIIENKFKIAGDFADAVHNLPEIFYREYHLKQYWKTYIKPFRKQYGEQYFDKYKPFFKGMNTKIIRFPVD